MTMRFPPPERLLHRLEDDHAAALKAMPTLAELSGWAANHTPDNDGFPAGGNSGARSSDATSTTERAAIARLDASDADVERIIDHALAGYEHLRQAASLLAAYVTPRHLERGRVNTVDVCPACDKPTGKVVSGFCPSCYRQWLREERPDRAWFVRRRKAERDAAKAAEEAAKQATPDTDPTSRRARRRGAA